MWCRADPMPSCLASPCFAHWIKVVPSPTARGLPGCAVCSVVCRAVGCKGQPVTAGGTEQAPPVSVTSRAECVPSRGIFLCEGDLAAHKGESQPSALSWF